MLKSKIKIITFVLPLFLLMGAIVPSLAQARGLVPCGGYADDKGTREPVCTFEYIFAMVARVTNFLITFAGLFAVFKITQAGFGMVRSMGNEEAITSAKNSLSNAVVGLVLVMMAYLLVNTVVNYLLLSNSPKELRVNLANPFDYLKK